MKSLLTFILLCVSNVDVHSFEVVNGFKDPKTIPDQRTVAVVESERFDDSAVHTSAEVLQKVPYNSLQMDPGGREHTLTFRPLMHQPRIYSGAPPGVHVTTVHAYDADRPRKKVEYSMPNALDYKYFVVDQKSGNVTSAMTIDKPVGESLQVIVTAMTVGSSQLENLKVAVTEFNEFAPQFEKREYQLELHTQTALNTTILQVKASDIDKAPYNAEIYYKMDQNHTSKYFNLDTLTGDLILIHPINDTQKKLTFGIFAEDGGSPKRWDYVPVIITIYKISAPQNVTVSNITHSTATVCWEEPIYGAVSAYGISFQPVARYTAFTVNLTVDYDTETCQNLSALEDDTVYVVNVFGWNEDDKGLLSHSVKFRTIQDGCKISPCKLGACESSPTYPWFICHCPLAYYGTLCELFNTCSTNPCGSNGKCQSTNKGDYTCICNKGYSGRNCSIVNPCLHNTNTCLNGGICQMTANNTYICNCTIGYFGQNCRHRNPCAIDTCRNGGICNRISDESFECLCEPGYTGYNCEFVINHCESNPCYAGSTCVNNPEGFICICPTGHSGKTCNVKTQSSSSWMPNGLSGRYRHSKRTPLQRNQTCQCPAESADTERGMFVWPATYFGAVARHKCPFGPVEEEKIVERHCLLINGKAVWESIDMMQCKNKVSAIADELVQEVKNITNNPSSITAESLQTASQAIETLSSYAQKDIGVAKSMVSAISNVMAADDVVLQHDENDTLTNSLLQTIDDFVSNVDLVPGQSLNVVSENIRIESLEWHPDFDSDTEDDDHINFIAPAEKRVVEDIPQTENTKNIPIISANTTDETNVSEKINPILQVFVPKEALQQAHKHRPKGVRVKFVVFYNDKLFQEEKFVKPTTVPLHKQNETLKNKKNRKEKTKVDTDTPVLQISVGDVPLTNLRKPLIYILPIATQKKASCVYWDVIGKKWSTSGLKTNQTPSKIICHSSHMTAFSVLLDITPQDVLDELNEKVLSIISYIGCGCSIIGLLATIITYLFFPCLRREHSGKILLNMSFSLIMMNVSFLVMSSKISKDNYVCAVIGITIHYLVLTSLSWMCVEALNMYKLLIQVFSHTETHYMLKRNVVAWGGPLLIVGIAAAVDHKVYYNSDNICMISPYNMWIYYVSFITPSSLILVANLVIFFMVTKVIFAPRLATKANNKNKLPIVTFAQVRGAFTVMVLLGVSWIFGPLAVGNYKLIFQYVFCVSNSLQGFLIFLVRCILYHEARNSWIYFFQTGKIKKHRGNVTSGTTSSGSRSGSRQGRSTNTNMRSQSTDSASTSFDYESYNEAYHHHRPGRKTSKEALSRMNRYDKHPNVWRLVKQHPQCFGKNNKTLRKVLKLKKKNELFELQKLHETISQGSSGWKYHPHYPNATSSPIPYNEEIKKYSKDRKEYENTIWRVSSNPNGGISRLAMVSCPSPIFGHMQRDKKKVSLSFPCTPMAAKKETDPKLGNVIDKELTEYFNSIIPSLPKKFKERKCLSVGNSPTPETNIKRHGNLQSAFRDMRNSKRRSLRQKHTVVEASETCSGGDDSSSTDIDDGIESSYHPKQMPIVKRLEYPNDFDFNS